MMSTATRAIFVMNLNDNNHTFTTTKATFASNAAASLAGAAFIIMMSYMGAEKFVLKFL